VLTMISRTKEKLRSNVNRALFIRTHVNRSIPIETKLSFPIIRFRLDRTRFQCFAIHASDESALRLRVYVGWVGRIGKRPKTVSAAEVFPAAVGNSSWIL